MRIIIRVIIVAALAHATYRVGSEYLNYARFRDAIRDAAMFKAKSDDELRMRVMELADEYDMPLSEDALFIARENREVNIEGSYRKPIEILPRFEYSWPFDFSLRVDTQTLLLPGAPVRQ
jgi:hypothetical protein